MYNLLDIIKQRYSCRNYKPERINDLTKRELLSYIQSNNIGLWGEKIDLQILESDSTLKQPIKLDYGAITNHNSYIVGETIKDDLNRMSYGYVTEKVVIKATALGLNSCWIGYFDENYFENIKISNEYEIPSIVIIGYADKESLTTKMMRFAVRAKKRKEWNSLFFLNNFSTPLPKTNTDLYNDALEMIRIAPSSGNTQPWRVVLDEKNNSFHFFKKVVSKKYEQRGLHDVDMGIALAHFELTSKIYNLQGKWEKLNSAFVSRGEDVNYMISWIKK